MASTDQRAILLVEDNSDDAVLLLNALRGDGLWNPLHIVNSGDEAIRYLRGEGQYVNRAQHPLPHLLVIDTTLNGTSGFDVLAWVRQQEEFKVLPAIMLSDNGGPAEKEIAVRLGASGYHHKPSSINELRALVGRMGDFWLRGGDIERMRPE
jgi:CheY-like chemotaxis protein